MQGFLALVGRQFARAAEPNASLLRSLAPFAGAGADKFSLELSQAPEHQSPVRCCCIGPQVLYRLEVRPSFSDFVQNVE